MENIAVKDILESQEKLLETIKGEFRLLEYNYYTEEIYEVIINDISRNIYSSRDSKNILLALYYSIQMMKDNISKGISIEGNDDIKEVIDGLITCVKNEHELSKLKHYGYLIGNIMFIKDLNVDELNRMVKLTKDLTYCQMKLINMYVISSTIPVPILQRENYTKIGIKDFKLLGLLQDTLDMIQKSILNTSGKLVIDVSQITPSEIKVQGIGTLLYKNLCLDKIAYSELEYILDLLTK